MADSPHPLGYDPDPASRGEGSSTGRTRHRSPSSSGPASPVRKVARYTGPDERPVRAVAEQDVSPCHARPPPLRIILRAPALVPTPSDAVALPPAKRRMLVGGGRPRRAAAARRGGASGGGANSVTHDKDSRTPRASRASRRTRSRRSTATPTTLESIAAEAVAIRAEAERLGLMLRDVTADGNCLFRALADQLWGDQRRYVEVRKLVCDHLESARDELGDFVAGFLNDGEDYDAYVRRMRGDGVYGSHIELLAASKVFRRSVRIILSQTSYTVEYLASTAPASASGDEKSVPAESKRPARRSTRSTTTILRAEPEADDTAPPSENPEYASALADYIPPIKPGASMLWLALFAEAEHYESVRRRDRGGTGPAEVPDSLAVPHARDVSEAARRERGESIPEAVDKRSKAKGDKDPQTGRLAQLLASLPAGHGVPVDAAAGVLARAKGDVGAAVEILIEDINLGVYDGDDASPDSGNTSATTPDPSATPPPSALDAVTDRESYRERAATPSSSEADPASPTSTAPTSPLSHASSDDDDAESEYKDSDMDTDPEPVTKRETRGPPREVKHLPRKATQREREPEPEAKGEQGRVLRPRRRNRGKM